MNLVISEVFPTKVCQSYIIKLHFLKAHCHGDGGSVMDVPLCSPRKTSLYFLSGLEKSSAVILSLGVNVQGIIIKKRKMDEASRRKGREMNKILHR